MNNFKGEYYLLKQDPASNQSLARAGCCFFLKIIFLFLVVVGAVFAILLGVAFLKYPGVKDRSISVPHLSHETATVPFSTSDQVTIDMVQSIGTHNSYKRKPGIVLNQNFRYEHEPILTQLRLGVRHFELDIHVASRDKMQFRIFHLQLVDDKTTCRSIKECLAPAAEWSRSVGGKHSPLYFMLDFKTSFWESARTSTAGVKSDQLLRLEAEIKEFWKHYVTPDDLRNTWPYPIKKANGKAFFMMRQVDIEGSLSGKLLHQMPDISVKSLGTFDYSKYRFVFISDIINQKDADNVKDLVDKRVMVRVRIHEPTNLVLDSRSMTLIEFSGAQLVTTDHPPLQDARCCDQTAGPSFYTKFSNDKLEKCNHLCP